MDTIYANLCNICYNDINNNNNMQYCKKTLNESSLNETFSFVLL